MIVYPILKFQSYQIKMSRPLENLIYIIALTITVLNSNPSHARLHESPTEAESRYGAPVAESSVIMLPLLKGTQELRYHHNGWRIRSAFINNQTAIISYMKLETQSTPDAVLQNDEIQAILKAESGGYQWMKAKRGTKVTNSKKYQGYFNSSSRVWKRGDGAVTWVSGNSALSGVQPFQEVCQLTSEDSYFNLPIVRSGGLGKILCNLKQNTLGRC